MESNRAIGWASTNFLHDYRAMYRAMEKESNISMQGLLFHYISGIVVEWSQRKKRHCQFTPRIGGGCCLLYITQHLLLEEGKTILHGRTHPKKKKKKKSIILPAPKMRSNMDTKRVVQRSSIGALQRKNLVYIHAHNTSQKCRSQLMALHCHSFYRC